MVDRRLTVLCMDSNETQQVTFTLKELFTAFLVVALPYLLVGAVWAGSHSDHLNSVYGLDNFLSFAGEVVAWPFLIFSDITLK